ncbi:MAG: TIGR00289 family protein [Candidatus Micrarchaeaceae archaeon]
MIATLFSGGKDSTLALHKAAESGLQTEILITMKPENEYSFMFHKVNIDLTRLQAQALGLRQSFVETKGEKELELEDLERALLENKITTLITGALASEYQKKRIDALCNKLNISHIAPLWHKDPLAELEEISSKYYAIITQVSAEGLDDTFLGERIGKEVISKLKLLHATYGIHMAFEGGEAESFVLDAPLFKKKIKIIKAHKVWDGKTGQYIIDEAYLISK